MDEEPKKSGRPRGSKYESPLREAIDAYWKEHHSAPPLRALMEKVGLNSTSQASGLIQRMTDMELAPDSRPIPKWVVAAIDGCNENATKEG
jgi:hypothetical protein